MSGGEPAFPHPFEGSPGLTKREYFAAMALQGLLASWPEHTRLVPHGVGESAIEFADATLEALAKAVQS